MNDSKLNKLLRQWRDVEPRGTFDDNVLRRIRQAEAIPARNGWLDWLRQSALATITAAVIGLMAGTIGGWQSAPRQTGELEFMAPTTLTGAYLTMRTK